MVNIVIPKTFWIVSSTTAVVFAAIAALQGTAHASTDLISGPKLLVAPSKLTVSESGELKFDTSEWSSAKQPDGTLLLTFTKADKKTKKVPEARAAILRSKEGVLESMTSYEVKPSEEATTVFFDGKSVSAFVTCENRDGVSTENKSASVGRVCVTATPKLCKAVGEGNVTPDIIKEMDSFEMRSLAILLTLRGPDHQLENVVKSGNRLGLKSALQTTKGQLLALARQINNRAPASAEQIAEEKKLFIDAELSKIILERSVPRLKTACTKI